jgi:uncharacterized protein
MITIQTHASGCLLSVRAQPNAKRNAIVGEQAEALKISITAPPEDGRANEAIVELLAEKLHLKRSQITILVGATNRNKKLLIQGIEEAELREKLSEWVK